MDVGDSFAALVRKLVGLPDVAGSPPVIDKLAFYRATVNAAKADGSPSHLEDSGALSAFDIRALPGSGIVVSFGEDYAQYHQSGTSKMAQRRLVPDEGDFNRSLWYPPIVEAYSNAILKDAGWRAAGADSASKD